MTILVNRLNRRVKILRPPGADELDEYGAPLSEWTEVATVWAAIEPLQGKEFFSAEQFNSEVTTRIRIRYREGVDRLMRVKHGETEFIVLYVIRPQFGKVELQLMCKEVQ